MAGSATALAEKALQAECGPGLLHSADFAETRPSRPKSAGAGNSSAEIIPFPAKRRPGRPAVYSDDLAWELCDRIAEGGMRGSLRAICTAPDMPGRSTVLAWLKANDEFRRRYELACWFRDEAVADEVVEIADAVTSRTVERARLQIDVRKWWLAKASPKKYGTRGRIEHSAPGAAGVTLKVEWKRYGEAVESLAKVPASAS